MAILCLLFVSLFCGLLNCSKPTERFLYKPYGPRMCEELCKSFERAILFMKEDLSCHLTGRGDVRERNLSDCSNRGITNNSSPTQDICKREALLGLNLRQACEEGKLDTVKYILSHDLEDINSRGWKGRTPIMAAAGKAQVEVFHFLTCQNCDMLNVDENNNTLLHAACEGGSIDIVRYLIDIQRLDTESKDRNGETPFMKAVYFGHIKIVGFLIEKGCNISAEDKRGYNVIHVASESGRVEMLEYLLSMRQLKPLAERVSTTGFVPIMVATMVGQKAVVEFLLRKGCNPKRVNSFKDTILHIGCRHCHLDIVKQILSEGNISINIKGFIGRTPAMIAAKCQRGDILKLLVSKGCNLRVKDNSWNNILHFACQQGRMDILMYLLKLKDVKGLEKGRNIYGKTPLQYVKCASGKAATILRKYTTV